MRGDKHRDSAELMAALNKGWRQIEVETLRFWQNFRDNGADSGGSNRGLETLNLLWYHVGKLQKRRNNLCQWG